MPAWQLLQLAEQRPQQLDQPGEDDLSLGLHAVHPEYQHAVGAGNRVVDQRGLADPRLAEQQQRAARSGTRVVEQPVESRSLRLTPNQHGLTLPHADDPRNGAAEIAGFPGSGCREGGATIAA